MTNHDRRSIIDDAIAEMVEMLSGGKPVEMATDEQVAMKIYDLGVKGYIPSEAIVEPIRDYLSGYGVLLSGPAGVGKTWLLDLLGARLRPVSEIMDYGLRDLHIWYDWTDGREVVIDDLGAEAIVNDYGTKEDLLKLVIAHRAERQKGRTSITTNLTAAQIAARYGDRTLSRILGMCRPHTLGGASRRRAQKHGQ